MATKIFIDQSANPPGSTFDEGIFANNASESEIVYNIGINIASLFKSDLFEVRLSRPTPTTVIGTDEVTSRRERTTMANDWPADLYITLHCSTSPDILTRGVEMYVRNLYRISYTIANTIMKNILEKADTINAGIYAANFYSLTATKMPAIELSVGFLSNPVEAKLLTDVTYQYQIASGIYNGIIEYYVQA